MSDRKETVTERELGILVVGGLMLVTGSLWWIKGLPIACLALGIILLSVAYCCAGKE